LQSLLLPVRLLRVLVVAGPLVVALQYMSFMQTLADGFIPCQQR
jgi:hypothetical protein